MTSLLHTVPRTTPTGSAGNAAPTRVLAVGVDTAVIPLLRKAIPTAALRLEVAPDSRAAGSLLEQEWDLVVAGLGEDAVTDLRLWLVTLEQARGHPRFIALMQQPPSPEMAAGEVLSLADLEAQHIANVLESTGGRIMEAAKILGVHRNTLARKLKALRGKNGKRPAASPGVAPGVMV